MEKRFILIQKEGKWLCIDTLHAISCEFEHKKFNETQKVEFMNEIEFEKEDAVQIAQDAAKWISEMADWLRANHYDKVL
ncbi:MAG: hypothetical protein LBP85_08465 [Prevotellaceae bacterium]|jgi:hypothetical protein|nr:hypothetical protein [Prevotellaceae bacterium]